MEDRSGWQGEGNKLGSKAGEGNPRENTCLPCYCYKYSTDLYHFLSISSSHVSPFPPLLWSYYTSFLFLPSAFIHIIFFPHPPSSSIFFIYLFQIVICGQRDAPDTTSLLAAVNSLFLPYKVSFQHHVRVKVMHHLDKLRQICHQSLKQRSAFSFVDACWFTPASVSLRRQQICTNLLNVHTHWHTEAEWAQRRTAPVALADLSVVF